MVQHEHVQVTVTLSELAVLAHPETHTAWVQGVFAIRHE